MAEQQKSRVQIRFEDEDWEILESIAEELRLPTTAVVRAIALVKIRRAEPLQGEIDRLAGEIVARRFGDVPATV